MTTPAPEELSVVIQGPVTDLLAGTVASVRRALPGAQVVVSTWRGMDTRGLDADVVVRSEDPGSANYRTYTGADSGKPFNTNRMLTSTRAGLERVDRGWILKLRNDTPLTSAAFLDWVGSFPARHPQLRVFSERVLTTSAVTRPSPTMQGYLFHPSDCVHFGRADDVVHLWSSPPVDEAANAAWQLGRERRRPDLVPGNWARYFNEQVLWLSCLERSGIDVGYDAAGHFDEDLAAASDVSIVNNFLVLEPWQFGVAFPKFRDIFRQVSMWQYLWFDQWLALYRRHCAPVAVAA